MKRRVSLKKKSVDMYNDYNTRNVEIVNKYRIRLAFRWHITYMPHIEKTMVVDKLGEMPTKNFEKFTDFEAWAREQAGQ